MKFIIIIKLMNYNFIVFVSQKIIAVKIKNY